jgi:hypothetical protein
VVHATASDHMPVIEIPMPTETALDARVLPERLRGSSLPTFDQSAVPDEFRSTSVPLISSSSFGFHSV